MGKTSRYPATGFMLLSAIKADGLQSQLAAVVDIAKGDVLHDDDSGYATNGVTAFANDLLGVSNADYDNTPQANLTAQFVPWNTDYRWIVAVEQNALITQGAIGSKVNLQSVNTIDINTTVSAGTVGFFINEIDVSALAIAANTYGFAIGHFSLI